MWSENIYLLKEKKNGAEQETKNHFTHILIFYPDIPTNKILFLKKGLLRGYKIIDGKDYTHHFYFENWFATDFSSFLNEKPSQIFIESIEKTNYYEFKKNQLLNLYNTSHQLERLGRIIAEKAYLATVEKMSDLQNSQQNLIFVL